MAMNRSPKTRRRRFKKLIIWLIVLLLLAALAWYAASMLRQEYTVTYDEYTAATGSISNALSFSGNLSLIDSASYSASNQSTVRKVYVAVGDNVSDGDKLVRLANGETIAAEFDGRVNTLSVAEGDSVNAGDALVQVADFTHMSVRFRVDEYDISEVAVGQTCTVTVTALERSFDSEIAAIDYISASGGNVAYYTATVYLDVDDGVYPGMQTSVSIVQEEANDVVVLKMDALSFDENNSAYVWMYNDASELEKVSVEVGVSNGNYVEIKSGLSDGDTVYVESQVESQASGLSGLLSGMFGSQQISAPGGGSGGMPDFSSGSRRDFSNMDGNMPSFGGNGGGRSGSGTGGGQP